MSDARQSSDIAASGPRVTPGPLWAPLAPLYAAGVLVRRWAYDSGLFATSAPPVFTISVGGLEAGGSGKTPVTALVLAALVADGRRPGLLSRGYGRPTRKLCVRERGEPPRAAAIGDEPAMLAAGIDVPVAAAPSRVEGAAALASRGIDTLVLDDGFQHRALGRDVDIVVLRGEAPLGDGHLLPWGTLREPPSSLRRAHIVWLHFRARAAAEPLPWLRRYAPGAALVVSQAVPEAARDSAGGAVSLSGARVVAAAGIARPEEFAASLTALGAELVSLVRLRDHHRFGPGDVTALAALARAAVAVAVVVTPKDAVKLVPLWDEQVPLWVVGTRPRIIQGSEALAARLRIRAGALPPG